MRRAAFLLTLAMTAGATPHKTVRAHESRPLYIEVTEKAPLQFSVQWKIPPSVDTRNAPEILMAEGCEAAIGPALSMANRGSVRRRTYRCEVDPAGSALRIRYALFNPSVSALVRISRLSGETHSLLASPEQTEVIIPAVESFGGVARDYLSLGVRHILEGYDHLLFLVCLMLIAGTWRRILITITGFTLAHSITLALSALGLVRVPIPAVEAAIALSIVFLAVEIVRGDKTSLAYRYPIAVSSSFGLLHGFGFAAVLGETGLPQTEIPAALLFFNLGVELGQIVFVMAVVIIYQVIRFIGRTLGDRDLSIHALRPLQTPAAYAVGILASFWMIQRVATFWTS
jgi:hydrogenase/urease accessory protein HupE